MKVLDLLKVVDGNEVISIMDKAGSSWNVLSAGHCEAFVRAGNTEPLMDKEILSVYVGVVEPFGLPGLHVIVK